MSAAIRFGASSGNPPGETPDTWDPTEVQPKEPVDADFDIPPLRRPPTRTRQLVHWFAAVILPLAGLHLHQPPASNTALSPSQQAYILFCQINGLSPQTNLLPTDQPDGQEQRKHDDHGKDQSPVVCHAPGTKEDNEDEDELFKGPKPIL